jgi:hypothetical protein
VKIVGQFASALLVEVEQDREVLQPIADLIGNGSPDLKQAAAWAAPKK